METIKIIDPYQNYEMVPQEPANGTYGNELLNSVKSLQVGFGAKVLRVDRDGLWLGAETFATAPFKVDMLGNITATSLSSGYIPVGGALADVGAGNITGTYISSGAITTAKLSATAIDGMTITGARVRTSSGSSRVQLNESTNALEVYSSSVKRVVLDNDEITFYNSSANQRGGITANTTEVELYSLNGGNLTLSQGGSLYTIIFNVNTVQQGYFSTAGLTLNNHLNMDGNDITSVDRVEGTAGYIDFTGTVLRASAEFSPVTNNSSDLGDPSEIWNDLYASDVNYNTLTVISDARLKENVVATKYGLKELLSLNPINFNYIEKTVDFDTPKYQKIRKNNPEYFDTLVETVTTNLKKESDVKHIGFIAQEVAPVMPELVTMREDGMYTLHSTELIPVLVRAIQELKAEIELLKQ